VNREGGQAQAPSGDNCDMVFKRSSIPILLIITTLLVLFDVVFLRWGGVFFVSYTPPEKDKANYSDTGGGVFKDTAALPVVREVSGTLRVSPVGGALLGGLSVSVDDCLQELTIDGRRPPGVTLPYCNWATPLRLKTIAHEFLGKTDNSVKFTARFVNRGGPGRFAIEPVGVRWLLILRVTLYTTLFSLILLAWFEQRSLGFSAALLVGVALRMTYFYRSDYRDRSHDLLGHIEYITHMLTHWSIPNPLSSWEFHQGPIFYSLVAGLVLVVRAIAGIALSEVDAALAITLLCSLATLSWILKAVWVSGLAVLAANKREPRATALLTAVMMIVATNPNLIFSTMRISNDPMIMAIVSYVAYRGVSQVCSGVVTPIVVGLIALMVALLTKTNGVIVCGLWVIADSLSVSPRLVAKRGALMALCLITIGGIYSGYRYSQSKNFGLFFRPSVSLNSGMLVPNEISSFTTLNPLRIISDVYVDNWSDAKHRANFWEHLIKNVMFGEFNHGRDGVVPGRIMLGSALVLLMLIALSLVPKLVPMVPPRTYGALGLLLSMVMLLVYRIKYPFSCNQDIRLSPALYPMVAILVACSICVQSSLLFLGRALSCVVYILPTVQVIFLWCVL
jgi:hypothetical protein